MFLKFFLQPHKLVRSRMEVLGLIVVGGIHALWNVNKICIILITLQVRLNLDIRDHHYGLLLGYTSKEDSSAVFHMTFIFSTPRHLNFVKCSLKISLGAIQSSRCISVEMWDVFSQSCKNVNSFTWSWSKTFKSNFTPWKMGKSALKLNKTAKRRYIWRTNIAIINLGYFIHRNVNIRKTGLILPNCLINLKLFPPTCEYF